MIGLRLHCDDIVLRGAADGIAGVVLGCLMSDDGTLLFKVELMDNIRCPVDKSSPRGQVLAVNMRWRCEPTKEEHENT